MTGFSVSRLEHIPTGPSRPVSNYLLLHLLKIDRVGFKNKKTKIPDNIGYLK